MTARALLALVLCLRLLLPVLSDVDPSQCIAIWIFRLPCSEPVGSLVEQLKTWSSAECRDGPEKCRYEIIEEASRSIDVKHTSSQTGKVTTITFGFVPPAAPAFCKIKAISTTNSANGTRPNDYCLLRDLVEASGLKKAEGYKEICNKEKCPQKSSARCGKETNSR